MEQGSTPFSCLGGGGRGVELLIFPGLGTSFFTRRVFFFSDNFLFKLFR